MNKKRYALITGATGGIGTATAHELKKQNCNLILHGNSNKEALDKLKAQLSDECTEVLTVTCNLVNYEECKMMADEVLKKVNCVDILVNNAGITKDSLSIRMSEEDFRTVIETNLYGAFYLSKILTRPMIKQKWGRIINISSISGLHGNEGQANYSASKAALVGLTKTLAKEFAAKNILVNAVAPGFINTKMIENMQDNAKSNLLEKIPLGRIGNPEDVASTIAFLASEKAGYITGQVFVVDGGMSI